MGHLATLREYLIIPGKCGVPLLWPWWAKHKIQKMNLRSKFLKAQTFLWTYPGENFCAFASKTISQIFSALLVCLISSPPSRFPSLLNLAGNRMQWNQKTLSLKWQQNSRVINPCCIPGNGTFSYTAWEAVFKSLLTLGSFGSRQKSYTLIWTSIPF